MADHQGYGSGHPWYYHLGGAVLTPKQILCDVESDGYHGFLSDISEADRLREPKRSQALRRHRESVLADLNRDLSIYRRVVRKLRLNGREDMDACVAVSLKHNHLYNDFGHLAWLDQLLAVQGDLFG